MFGIPRITIDESKLPACQHCHVPLISWGVTSQEKAQRTVSRNTGAPQNTHDCPRSAHLNAIYLLGKRLARRREESGDQTLTEMRWSIEPTR